MGSLRAARNWERAARHFAERDLAAAEQDCLAVLAAEPGHMQAHWLLGSLLKNRGEFREATRHARLSGQALRDEPINAWLNTAWLLITCGESEDAIGLLRRLHNPPQALAGHLVDAAIQCSALDCHEDALKLLDRALAMGVEGPIVHQVRGQTLQFLGDFDQAKAEYQRAIDRQPDFAPAHWALAQLLPGDVDGARIDRLQRLLGQASPGTEGFAFLSYALFREFDKLDDTRSAWTALERGAASRRSQVSYDAAAESGVIDSIISATRGLPLEGQAAAGGVVPIFIVGMPRTGTTLLERILGNHEGIAICGELSDLRLQYNWVANHDCNDYLDRHSASLMARLDAPLLGSRYLEKTAWRRGKARFQSDKNQTNFLYCGAILRALPAARIIHMQRGPMDSCFSNLKELFVPQYYTYSYAFADLASHFHNYRRLMRHWQDVAPGAILDVHYEDLVRQPEAETARILAFCGLGAQAAQVDIVGNRNAVSTASSAQVRQPIHQRNVDGWTRYAGPLAPLRDLLSARGEI